MLLSDDTVGLLCKTLTGLHNSVAGPFKMRMRVLKGLRFQQGFYFVRAFFFFTKQNSLSCGGKKN